MGKGGCCYGEYGEARIAIGEVHPQLANCWMRLLRVSKSKRILFKVLASTRLNIEFLVVLLFFYHILQRLALGRNVGHGTSCIFSGGTGGPEDFPLVKAYSSALHIPLRMV